LLRLAINGFGRIGRTAFRIAYDMPGVEVVAVNDLVDVRILSYLLNYDTVYGEYERLVSAEHNGVVVASEEVTYPNEYFSEFEKEKKNEDYLLVDGRRIHVFSEKDPGNLPWKELDIDVVLECTGVFADFEKAKVHLEAGAKKVILSASGKGEGKTMIFGTPSLDQDISSDIISNASCTTNCVAPVMAILDENFGVESSWMTTIHSYTADQNTVDGPHHEDLRRGRAAAGNIVPTTTGAAITAAKVVPTLEEKFDGIAVRVPTLSVSLAIMTAVMKKPVTVEEVNQIFQSESQTIKYKGIVSCVASPKVSSDFKKDPHSAIVDLALTNVVNRNLLTVFAWYDNEWGYASRLVEMAQKMGSD